jgi:hypothetical protein
MIARVVASHGLAPPPAAPYAITPGAWNDLLTILRMQRLCGLAVQATEDGVLALTPEQADELLEHHEMQLGIDLRVEQLVLAALSALTTAGIDARLLKGPATAHRFYADPSLRSFGDADILVPRPDFRAAIAVFEQRGFTRKSPPPRPWFDRYVKAACLLTADGMQLDLHQRLADGPYGVTGGTDALFRDRPDYVTIGTTPVPCLSPPIAFIHACIHAALGDPSPRYVSLRDVAQILRSDLAVSEVTSRVAAWQLDAVVARALGLVERWLGHRCDGPIAARYREYQPSPRDRWRLTPYLSTGPRFEQQTAAAFWALPSLNDKVAYAAALAFPSRRYLRARGMTYRGRVHRAATSARAGRPR